ncbi:hypothetical protein SISNIDRAFT_457280 [Sistotremastrum niveocremeum HHB9708]|uniref:Uncharacterized protein n=2 Tax=Sistotremastraceae TaxID=3402574 RepID=A0A164RVW2_9AGAM|nr:hypothetical protein SISNIDRAFT_457280 [Sistotremastrum niveocremeum HHB9708]KZT38706.1 hypothetical protein SISSUDRAFT_1046571 [Sistotremastrum suecicum HHB10207 ss-3]
MAQVHPWPQRLPPVQLDAADIAPDLRTVDAIGDMIDDLRRAQTTFDGWITDVAKYGKKSDQAIQRIMTEVTDLRADTSQALETATEILAAQRIFANTVVEALFIASSSSAESPRLFQDDAYRLQSLGNTISFHSDVLRDRIILVQQRVQRIRETAEQMTNERIQNPSRSDRIRKWLGIVLDVCTALLTAVSFLLVHLGIFGLAVGIVAPVVPVALGVAAGVTQLGSMVVAKLQERINVRNQYFDVQLPAEARLVEQRLQGFPAYIAMVQVEIAAQTGRIINMRTRRELEAAQTHWEDHLIYLNNMH